MTLPTSSKPIGTLSPTRLEKLRCPARVAFDQTGHGVKDAPAVAQLGTAVHLAVERLLDGAEPAVAWTIACDELAVSGGDPRDLPGARRTELRFIRKAPELLHLVAEVQPTQTLPEEELLSADESLGGTADLVLLRTDDVVVVDHKTGLVTEEGMPKEGYERQIQIYAGLAAERFARPAARGVLMSMREGVVEVDVHPDRVSVELTAARAARASYNDLVPGPQPAAPSADTCRWCDHKASCDGFWDALDGDWVAVVGHCLVIEVARAETAANGLATFAGEVRAGTTRVGEHTTVAEAPAAAIGELTVAQQVRVTGLRVSKRADDVLRWSPWSQLEIC